MTANLTIETFPNEAAADYIRGKAVADPTNFGNLPDQLKQRAFTVASIEQLDALKRMRDIIAKLPEGASWDEAKREIASEISPFTGGDMKAAKARADFMLRTHGFQAYAVARHQQQMSVARRFPYWQYETVGDSRVRPGHAALDGKVLRVDDPWWKTHYPPWDWGCRCIVNALDEEDAEEIGITESNDMPTPERSGSFTFDPTNAGIDIDALSGRMDEPDWKLRFVAPAKNVTMAKEDGTKCTMWDFMLEQKMRKVASPIAGETQGDGNERALVIDFNTGKQLGKVATGDANGVKPEIPEGATVCTLHTHPNGDNTPSPADLFFGHNNGSKGEYIASRKKLRRWQWLKTPTPEDADLLKAFAQAHDAGDFNRDAYEDFLERLALEGFIKMEILA
jgi:SPP1 gp7 family putative phage head morphogenesis protein